MYFIPEGLNDVATAESEPWPLRMAGSWLELRHVGIRRLLYQRTYFTES